jgi:protein-S-isoprenylcysteine O-methyltransferase Ste14
VRHPIYTGLLLAIFGSGVIALGEWRGVVALALVTAAFLRKIQIEERFLRDQFGDAYDRYRQEVPASRLPSFSQRSKDMSEHRLFGQQCCVAFDQRT